jgi:hypothetical protein
MRLRIQAFITNLALMVMTSPWLIEEAMAQGSDPFDGLKAKIKAIVTVVSSALISLNAGIVAAGFLFKVDFLKEWSKDHLKGMIIIVGLASASLAFRDWLTNILTNIPSLWGV